jgi:acetolactate synthase small subunit
MLARQRNVCAICETEDPGAGRNVFVVDHDHDSKQIRKLLCALCNKALGALKDSSKIALKAAEYLQNHGK